MLCSQGSSWVLVLQLLHFPFMILAIGPNMPRHRRMTVHYFQILFPLKLLPLYPMPH